MGVQPARTFFFQVQHTPPGSSAAIKPAQLSIWWLRFDVQRRRMEKGDKKVEKWCCLGPANNTMF